MKFLSVCSGIEAASVAWRPLGWEAEAFSEIEPFPCAVLAHRFPSVPNLGDITKYKDWENVGKFDLLVGGTPCQSFSVAGKRGGLDDLRGQLMFSYLGILEKFQPRWCVWENVPGVLSSNNGLDFGQFLSGLEKCGYGWAYRILDAQYFGVPQRRRRVFVVGYLGDFSFAAKVLFERDSLRGNPAPSRKARKEIAKPVMAGSNKQDPELETYIYDMRGNGDGKNVTTLTGDHAGRPTDYTPVVTQYGDIAGTLTNRHDSSPCSDRGQNIIGCFMSGAGAKAGSISYDKQLSPTLRAADSGNNRSPSIVINDESSLAIQGTLIGRGEKSGPQGVGVSETMFTLTTTDVHVVSKNSTVRRLTPRECERLQGFPDDWTRIPYRGKPSEECADSPRYKSIGNSMAVPVMRWIGERIQLVESKTLC